MVCRWPTVAGVDLGYGDFEIAWQDVTIEIQEVVFGCGGEGR